MYKSPIQKAPVQLGNPINLLSPENAAPLGSRSFNLKHQSSPFGLQVESEFLPKERDATSQPRKMFGRQGSEPVADSTARTEAPGRQEDKIAKLDNGPPKQLPNTKAQTKTPGILDA